MRQLSLRLKPFNYMRTIQFSSENAEGFYAQLEKLKERIVDLCGREIDGRMDFDVSVDRYNMARQELKEEFPLEVIGMLDASGFINRILCKEERKWIHERKLRSLNPEQLRSYLAWKEKGGKS